MTTTLALITVLGVCILNTIIFSIFTYYIMKVINRLTLYWPLPHHGIAHKIDGQPRSTPPSPTAYYREGMGWFDPTLTYPDDPGTEVTSPRDLRHSEAVGADELDRLAWQREEANRLEREYRNS